MKFWLIVLCVIGGFIYYMYSQNKKEEMEEADEERNAGEDGEKGELIRTRLGSKWRVVSSSSVLIEGAHGKRDALVSLIKRHLKAFGVPNIRFAERNVALTGVDAMFSPDRKMLVVVNKKLRGYTLFVDTEDYGKQLSVSWWLLLKENWLTRLLRKAELHPVGLFFMIPVVILAKYFYARSRVALPELMNVFDRLELSSYCTTVHHAMNESVEAVMKDLHLNSAKISWQTRGFFPII